VPPILSASLAINHCGDEVDLTLRCIQNADLEVTVFICDISPDELTSERLKWSFPGVIVLPQGKNTGVSLAHNAVLPHLQSKYHLFLDPGVSFHPSLLRTMVSYMEAHPNIAVLSPRFFRENGQELFFPRRQISLRYMLGTALAGFGGCFRHWNMEYTFADNDVEMPAPVDSAPVTFLLVRTGVFSSLNGFDPAFTSTQEDADLCRRIQEQRLGSVVFHPDMAVYCRLPDVEHFSRTARTHRLRTVLRYFMKWGITW
jgi:GT2 family glycosyltransferase